MTLGIAILLLGLFGVPLLLLTWGHKLRRLDPRRRRAFWGAVTGHCIAALVALTVSMIPAEMWTATDTVRGFFGLWALFVFPLAGGITGAVTAR